MSATVAAAVKAAIVILSNEEARKKVGWGIVAILSPLIVLVVLLCAILSGTSQHNVSAVELCFHGGSISASATPEYQRYIEDMRNSFDQLDEVIAEINQFLQKLPEEKRCMFVLRYWYVDSISEIAGRLGRSENYVSVTLNRIRGKLHTHLTERGFEV